MIDVNEHVEKASEQLTLGSDDVWRVSDVSSVSFPGDGHEALGDIEERSFWFNHRNAALLKLMEQFPYEGPFLDIGGGSGYVSLGLTRTSRPSIVLEPDPAGARNAAKRKLPVIHASLDDAQLKPCSFHGAGMFDVLEHIEDDVGALRSVHRILASDGRLFLTVPAHSALWSNEDVYVGHYRRYGKRSVSSVLHEAGFEVDYAGYFFGALVPAIFLLRSIPSRFASADNPGSYKEGDHKLPPAPIGSVISATLEHELRAIGKGRALPLGSSVIVVARSV